MSLMRMSGSAPALVLAIATFVAAPSSQTVDHVVSVTGGQARGARLESK